jgi:hypothetical protein
MKSTGSKSARRKASQTRRSRADNETLSDTAAGGELWFWPYRSFAQLMMPACHTTLALIHISRELADEFREVVRREQDLLLVQSEKFLRLTCEEPSTGKAPQSFAPEAMEEIYDTTVSGMRELTKAMADAQTRSLMAIRDFQQDGAARGDGKTEHRESA